MVQWTRSLPPSLLGRLSKHTHTHTHTHTQHNTNAQIDICLLVQALKSSSTGKGGLIMSESIKGELAMVGTLSTVSHTSKWQTPDWKKESDIVRLHGFLRKTLWPVWGTRLGLDKSCFFWPIYLIFFSQEICLFFFSLFLFMPIFLFFFLLSQSYTNFWSTYKNQKN